MIQVSIFPKCKALPSNKEEKKSYAKYSSKPYLPVVVNINTDDDLIDIISTNSWSPFIFKKYRRQDGFIRTDFAVLDIDNGMTIEEAEVVVEGLSLFCICLPSTSHTSDNHRFRLIFPLSKPISDVEIYKATMSKLSKYFPVDPQCIGDTARFYYGCMVNDGFVYESDLLPPEKPKMSLNELQRNISTKANTLVLDDIKDQIKALYGEDRSMIPEQVDYFLRNASDGLEGEMYIRGNSFLFTLGLQGCDKDVVKSVFYSIYPYEVTSVVESTVDKMIQDGIDQRKREDVDNSKTTSYTSRRRRRS